MPRKILDKDICRKCINEAALKETVEARRMYELEEQEQWSDVVAAMWKKGEVFCWTGLYGWMWITHKEAFKNCHHRLEHAMAIATKRKKRKTKVEDAK